MMRVRGQTGSLVDGSGPFVEQAAAVTKRECIRECSSRLVDRLRKEFDLPAGAASETMCRGRSAL